MAFFSNGQTGETGWARVQRQDEAGRLYSKSGDCNGRLKHACCDTYTAYRIPRKQPRARSKTADTSVRHQCLPSATHSTHVWCRPMRRQRQVIRGSNPPTPCHRCNAASHVCANLCATTYSVCGAATISLLLLAHAHNAGSITTSANVRVLDSSFADKHGWYEDGPG